MKLLGIGIALAALVPLAAHAQNLVSNADFDTTLDPWLVGVDGGSAVWDGSIGSPAPGSAHLMAGAGIVQHLTQCIALPSTLASSFSLSADVYMFADSNSTSAFPYGIQTFAYAGATCSDAVYNQSNAILQPVGVETWTAVANNYVSMPAGFQSMLVTIFVAGGFNSADYAVDHIVLTQITDRIFATGFELYEGFQ